MDPNVLTAIALAALMAFVIVRRVRRTIGRQAVQAGRLWFRIGVLTVVAALLVATSAAGGARTLGALIGGLACGAALGYLGLRHTRFETTPEGRFYTPHTYIGLSVTVLFLGRLLYRFFYLPTGADAMAGANPDFAAAYHKSPLTLGIFAVLAGYYVLFYAGVLVRTRAAALPAPDPVSPD